jgi:hypothetical protein
LNISHRSPWGLWTSAQRDWYADLLMGTGIGFPASVYGTFWLVWDPVVALALYTYV